MSPRGCVVPVSKRASPAQETLVEHCKALMFTQELVMHVAKECGDSTALAAIFGDMAAYLKEPACDTFGMSQHDLSVYMLCEELVRGNRHKEISRHCMFSQTPCRSLESMKTLIQLQVG